ncbi:MAG: RES family NAD+ phosphorylase [Candidatus Symbiobacter sp.]|nr:RES family NAD+ phosphorylase [Candidatus Symbiobacter sp.]
MSYPIWTADALRSEIRPYRGVVWRFQHATGIEFLCAGAIGQLHLNKLLASVKYPSRFRRGDAQGGVFYAAEKLQTAAAEVTFYQLLFFYLESPDIVRPESKKFSAFSVTIDAQRTIDLTQPNLSRDQLAWTKLNDHTDCQNLAEQARIAEVQAIRYWSVRTQTQCSDANLAVLHPSSLEFNENLGRDDWYLNLRSLTQAEWREGRSGEKYTFSYAQFQRDPRLKNFALNAVS